MGRIMKVLMFGLVVLSLAAATATPAAAAGKSGKSVERPHKTTSVGISELDTSTCDLSNLPFVVCPQEISDTTIIGTHIGRSSSTGSGSLTLDISVVCDGGDNLTGNPWTNSIDSVIVAPDGSELYTHASISGCFVDFGVGADTTGTVTITGGTGRFEGATGSQAFTGFTVGDRVESTTVGTITY
jgi:hypothetical protein